MKSPNTLYFTSVVQTVFTLLVGLGSITSIAAVTSSYAVASEAPVIIAPPVVNNAKVKSASQSAVFAGGCFWGVQGVFEHVRGVRKVVSGYTGGEQNSAQYETVSSGSTGHAESVQITFDPAEVSYGELLQVFFSVTHDPTQLNRQGPDSGSQYRSNIFYTDDTQKNIAKAYIAQLTKAHAFPGKGFHVMLGIEEPEEAERVFAALAQNGTIQMPIAETFWTKRFGMLVDQFNIPWMINCEKNP